MSQEVPEEKNHWTEAQWKSALALFLRFVDDGFCLTRVNFENSMGFKVSGEMYRIKHAVQSQNVFRYVVREAEDIGMVVNAQKTAMMCISGAMEIVSDVQTNLKR